MRNLLAGFAATLILTGCGLPPALTVASTVADGISYIASGKSVSDHALSAVTEQDCAVLRVLDEREICIEYDGDDAEILLASAPGIDTWGPVDDMSATGRAVVSVEVLTAQIETVSTVAVSGAQYAAAVPAVKPGPVDTVLQTDIVVVAGIASSRDRVTVLGSYRNPANAERALIRHASLTPRIVETATRRGTLFRIVSNASVGEARDSGIVDAWPLDRTLKVAALR